MEKVFVVEVFKVRVIGNEKTILGSEVFAFDEQLKAYEWLITLPMDASDIDYYFKSEFKDVNKGSESIPTVYGDGLKGAQRIKDLALIMRGR